MSDTALSPPSAGGRNFSIDFLRGLAVLAVIQTHAGFHYMFPESYRAGAIKILGNGYYGVTVFFTISGFLITSRSIARYGRLSSLDLREFYVMRFARITPPLFLAIVTLWILYLLGVQYFVPEDPDVLWRATYAALTFQYNQVFGTLDVDGMRSWSVLWSLSIEELFYFAFPPICLFTRRTLIFCTVMIALIVIGPAIRTDSSQIYNWWGCADALAIGCLTAVITAKFQDAEFPPIFYGAMKLGGLLIIGAIYLDTLAGTHPRFTLTGISFGSALFLSAAARQPTLYFSRMLAPTALCGVLSYELYLFHRTAVHLFEFRIIDSVTRHFPQSMAVWISGALFYVAIILISAVIARFYSEPLNGFIRRFYAQPMRMPDTAAIAAIPMQMSGSSEGFDSPGKTVWRRLADTGDGGD